MLRFCTLFDIRYTTRALAMLESLEDHCTNPKEITILAMDDHVPQLLARIGRPEWKMLRVTDLKDAELHELERKRPHKEFCWTCVPALVHYMISALPEADMVIYVDADLFFFDDPAIMLDELEESDNILIHEHRFSPDRIDYEQSSGRFNVGFVAFRVGEEARACASRWRGQVIERCELDPENGYCGDQGYLNEWPQRYPGLRIMRNIGGGTAPWNLAAYQVDGDKRRPRVDGIPVTFFHYHSFRTITIPPFGMIAAQPARGYEFSHRTYQILFRNYARRVRALTRQAKYAGFKLAADQKLSLWDALRGWQAGRCISAL